MKLRDKKTGEILEISLIQTNCECLTEHEVETLYGEKLSLATLNKYYKDYTSAEPIIKDEKIRKAVRAWAEANDYSIVKIGFDMVSEPNKGCTQIHFEGSDIVDEDKYGVHTLAELCGEEEE